MEKEQSKIGVAILITAIVVGGAVYYFTNSKTSSETASTKPQNTSYNQNSKEYAVMGRELWSAFSCSTWASHFYDKTKLNHDDLQKSIAENKYRDGNCQLIGK